MIERECLPSTILVSADRLCSFRKTEYQQNKADEKQEPYKEIVEDVWIIGRVCAHTIHMRGITRIYKRGRDSRGDPFASMKQPAQTHQDDT